MSLYVFDHPVIKHKVSILRDETTETQLFRTTAREISMLMFYEITRDFTLEKVKINTPICEMEADFLSGLKPVIVPILRAGLGMVDGMLEVLPTAKVGHIGMYRDEETLEAVEYFAKFPNKLDERQLIIVDPMLATGATAVAAIDLIKKRGAKNIKFACLVACPEGVEVLKKAHPEIDVYVAALDSHLNEASYIVPGLGDAGDRLFGTK
ncbi:MAG: uracil phosphoribosyltransferase [Mycoplasmatales bacterium]